MNRIDKKFKILKQSRKKAFIAFITAGYPSLTVTKKLIPELEKAGVDIIELGVPFTDPMADGPVIQEASKYAMDKGICLASIMQMVKMVRQKTQVPICLMTYYNPVFCFGEDKFAKVAQESGVDGVIVPDLPPEEAKGLIVACRKNKISTVFFVAPTSTTERIKLTAKFATGFIYYVSLTGVTGARKALPQDLVKNIKVVKRLTKKPLCVGFGISTRDQVKELCMVADGVIIGSAIVKKIKENIGKTDLIARVGNFAKSLI